MRTKPDEKHLIICSKVNNKTLIHTNHRLFDWEDPASNVARITKHMEEAQREVALITEGLGEYIRKCKRAGLLQEETDG